MPLLGATGGGSAKGFGALANLGYYIKNSLRFRLANSAYLRRTPGSSGSLKTWTASFWYKPGELSTDNQTLFSNAVESDAIRFQTGTNSRELLIYFGAGSANLATSQVFRDPAAWYHIVVATDTTQGTSSNRIKVYVNGTQVTSFLGGQSTYPSQNYETSFNRSGFEQEIGRRASSTSLYLDGYMAEVNWIDGQQLDASYFGKTDAATGQWIPKKFAGTYGTNGYYLKFSDIALTSGSNAGLGKDFSGNGNYFNTNNISVTSGVTYDAMTDSPTLSAAASNYCTINPLLDLQTYATYSEGNLKVSTTAASGFSPRQQSKGTMAIPSSGKWYFAANASDCGIAMANDDPNRTQYGASILTTHVRYQSTGSVLLNGNSYATVASFTSSDEVGLAIDMDALTVGVYKNGSLLTTVTGVTSGFTYYPMTVGNSSATAYTAFWNFGQRPFAYTPPTGYKALNTFNLP